MVPYRSQRPRLIAFGAAVVYHLVSLLVVGWWMIDADGARTAVRLGLGVALAGFGVVVGLFAAWIRGVSRNLPALGSTVATPTFDLQRVWAESQSADPVEGSDARNLVILVCLGTLPFFATWAAFAIYDSFVLVVLLMPAAVCALVHVAAWLLALQIASRLAARQAAQWRDVQLRAQAPTPDAGRLR